MRGRGSSQRAASESLAFAVPAACDFFPPEATKPDQSMLTNLWRQDLETAYAVVIATADEAVVGSAIARTSGDLARLHVHPTRWRMGTGRRLHDASA